MSIDIAAEFDPSAANSQNHTKQSRRRPMLWFAVLSTLVGLPLVAPAMARQAAGPEPTALTHHLSPLDHVHAIAIPALDMQEVQQTDEKDFFEGLPPRYAVPHLCRIDPASHGTWETAGDLAVWRLVITCPNALHINLGFTRFVMPEGGRLFLYNPDFSDVIRPFTQADNASHGELWTPPIAGNTLVIELTLPRHTPGLPAIGTRLSADRRNSKANSPFELSLTSINIGYRKFGPLDPFPGGVDSGSCNVDVICPEGDPWRLEIPAVGVISTGGSRFCSGFLVNNVRQDKKPYFITANHCGITAGNAASLVVFWNYQNSTCRAPGSPQSGMPGDGSLSQFSTGSTFRAAYIPADITLVELSQNPPPQWQLSYLGWDILGDNAPSGAVIHHPNTEEKRITLYNTWTNDSAWPACNTTGSTHVRAFYSLGTTEPGSSGSPIFDSNKHVIGQLTGGPASCFTTPPNSYDCYGRISAAWEGGGTSATQLRAWLDPDDAGVIALDTIGPGLTITPVGNVAHVGQSGGPFTNNPTNYTISNSSGASANYVVSIVAGGTAPILINGGVSPIAGTLGQGGSAAVSVSLHASANLLPVGVYNTTIRFQDTTNGIETLRLHRLEVGQVGFAVSPASGVFGSGPVGGPFAGSTLYTITNTRPTPATVRVSPQAGWISLNGGPGGEQLDFSLPSNGSSVQVTVGFAAQAGTLSAGIWDSAVAFTNVTGGGTGTASDTSRPVQLEVGSYVYASGGGPWSIPDNNSNGVSSIITVADAYCLSDVNVTVNVSHSWVGDLKFVVRHNNVAVAVIDRPGVPASTFGCDQDNFANLALDDEGTGGAIEVQCAANLGSPPNFTPNESLGGFDGGSVFGEWKLTVSDHAGQDVGALTSWSLKVLPQLEACPPVAYDVEVTVPVIVTSNIALNGSSTVGNLNYVVTSLPEHGRLFDPNGSGGGAIVSAPHVLVNGGSVVRYRPDANYAGGDEFTYQVNDGQYSNIADVEMTVGGPQLVHDFPLDTNPGWSMTGPPTNGWGYGRPAGMGGDPSSGFSGSNVLGYNLNGAYPNNMPEHMLTSTAIYCGNLSDVAVKFRRWLGVEQATYDHARFQISLNGTSWTTIWENPTGIGQSIAETAWSQQTYAIPQANGQATLYLRWIMGPTDGTVVFAGWNLDDVQVWGIRPPCLADCTSDGMVNVNDLLAVLNSWGPVPNGSPADVAPPGGNGVVNVNDLLAVINGWGACP